MRFSKNKLSRLADDICIFTIKKTSNINLYYNVCFIIFILLDKKVI